MRPAIANLTKSEYADLVTIQDHRCTTSQRIGDRVESLPLKQQLSHHRDLWYDNGRTVPGVIPQIFFWDLEGNAEGRPVAGLSACNYEEANAAAALVKWFLDCGVPASGISVITPYKGQKGAIIKSLRAAKALSKARKGKGKGDKGKGTSKGSKGKGTGKGPNALTMSLAAEEVTVSTVDRYQGDENDIVILSLVRTRPGNRFVALKNRFVVACSRARIGFYIIGSSDAVIKGSGNRPSEGPRHWCEFYSSLGTEGAGGEDMLSGTGSALPICCPRHSASRESVARSQDFPSQNNWGSFCSLPCSSILKWCGHTCAFPCHPPDQPHNTADGCITALQRPCRDHQDVPLTCGALHENVKSKSCAGLDQALKQFECDVEMTYQRPECRHTVQLSCFEYTQLRAGGHQPLPPCDEIEKDYVHPSCSHVTKDPTCADRRTWEATPPRCEKKVIHNRSCGCVQTMLCWEKVYEIEHPSQCGEAVNIPRPRCSHVLSLRCSQAVELRRIWAEVGQDTVEDAGSESVLVVHGVEYGMAERELAQLFDPSVKPLNVPECQTDLRFLAACGHIVENVPCSTAFLWAAGELQTSPCDTLVAATSPMCGHEVDTPCWVAKSEAWLNFPPLYFGSLPERQVTEAALLDVDAPAPVSGIKQHLTSCKKSVTVVRQCSHSSVVRCSRLKQALPPCQEEVPCELKCGHTAMIKCASQETPTCLELAPESFTYPCGIHTAPRGTCKQYADLLSISNPQCPEVVECRRFRCRHRVKAMCHLQERIVVARAGQRLPPASGVVRAGLDYCGEIEGVQACSEVVNFRHLCGHEQEGVPCALAFAWAEDLATAPQCTHPVTILSPLCHHELNVDCRIAQLLKEWIPWAGDVPWKPISTVGPADEDIIVPSIEHTDPMPSPLPPGIPREALTCEFHTHVTLACGHEFDWKCTEAHKKKQFWKCTESLQLTCDECAHSRAVTCHMETERVQKGAKQKCDNQVEKLCMRCQLNQVSVACFKSEVHCNREATALREVCGHEATWICGVDEDPRRNPVPCLDCLELLWEAAVDSKHTISEEVLRQQVESSIPSDLVLVEHEILPVDIERLLAGQQEITSHCRDVVLDSDELPKGVFEPPNPQDPQWYDLVFCVADEGCTGFRPQPTPYGHGLQLQSFTSHALMERIRGNDQHEITVFVGMVFRYNMLADSPPFRREGKGAQKKANKQMKKMRSNCFDGVIPMEGGNADERIYWVPEAGIALSRMQFRSARLCTICMDPFTRDEGYECEEQHFTCQADLEEYVESECSPENMQALEGRDGTLPCPMHCDECTQQLTHRQVALHAPGAYDAYQSAHKRIIEKRLTDEIRQEERARLEAEQAMLAQLSDFEKQVRASRKHLSDELLTLKCPRCGQAFLDFNGCFALKCSSCPCGFCAWCLSDCGADAHHHVSSCPQKPAGADRFFGSQQQFEQSHQARQSRQIRAYLLTLDEDVRLAVVRVCAMDLRDTGHGEIPVEFAS
eukprot:TRINITY_DN7649_c0_g1_i2.p1 TRINITY_DN7649_c0_g1~~TRINITY_DN7649_c0_g1_i2.p1  ORF type:complete len:1491 (+),score=142.91 TRINITY_DN7649_c0_g1_i2:123-4595(+)